MESRAVEYICLLAIPSKFNIIWLTGQIGLIFIIITNMLNHKLQRTICNIYWTNCYHEARIAKIQISAHSSLIWRSYIKNFLFLETMAILDVTVHIFPKDHYVVPQNDPNQAWFNLAQWRRFKLEKANDECKQKFIYQLS